MAVQRRCPEAGLASTRRPAVTRELEYLEEALQEAEAAARWYAKRSVTAAAGPLASPRQSSPEPGVPGLLLITPQRLMILRRAWTVTPLAAVVGSFRFATRTHCPCLIVSVAYTDEQFWGWLPPVAAIICSRMVRTITT
jgi:hypothetical protein